MLAGGAPIFLRLPFLARFTEPSRPAPKPACCDVPYVHWPRPRFPRGSTLCVVKACACGSKASNDCVRTPLSTTGSYAKRWSGEFVRQTDRHTDAVTGTVTLNGVRDSCQCAQQYIELTCPLNAGGLQPTADCARASTMEPPGFLGHPITL